MKMRLTQKILDSVETPCLVVDVPTVRANIAAMQRQVEQAGCALRPHVKTHKMPLFAKMQIEAGAKGITCAKVSEAEVMAAAGIDDIFIAYPMVGEHRTRRALALARTMRRLILAVDSEEGALALSGAAQEAGLTLEVRLEIDTGAGRTGIPMDRAPELAAKIAAMPGLRLTGIYTFKSLLYRGEATLDNAMAAQEEGEMMERTAEAIRAAGVEITEISAGSSPTGTFVAETGKVTEVRPGTYIFKDVMQQVEHVAQPDELAVRYVATVVSTNHEEYAVIDGGTKTFPSDVPLHQAPGYYPGYAVVEGNPNLSLSFMNEEHGIITAKNGHTGLHVGQKITLLPIHVCTAVNLQNSVYLIDGETLTCHKVDARGMLV
jgi:D-serine deaminase-like pyridoxal phosphate-dependent protein